MNLTLRTEFDALAGRSGVPLASALLLLLSGCGDVPHSALESEADELEPALSELVREATTPKAKRGIAGDSAAARAQEALTVALKQMTLDRAADRTIDAAFFALRDVAQEDLIAFRRAERVLREAAPVESEAVMAARVALRAAAIDEFATLAVTVAIALQGEPVESSAFALEARDSLRTAAPVEFAALAEARDALRTAAPTEFAAWEAAGAALQAADPFAFAAWEAANKVSGGGYWP